MEAKAKAAPRKKQLESLCQIADILAEGILRLHLRDVRNHLKKKRIPEKDLEVSPLKSLHRLEPKQRGERR